MRPSMTEIANAVTTCKKGHVRCPMATSRPFVVCSLSTKRYAPSKRVSVQKWPVSPKQRSLASHEASIHGSLPSVVPKAEPRPRLGCTACSRNYQSSIGVVGTSRERQDATAKATATGIRKSGVSRRLSVSVSVTETAARVQPTSSYDKKPVVAVDYTGKLAQDQMPAPLMPITYLQAVSPSLSPPPSPDLSSFPSQSWTIVANVDVKQISTPVTICGDEDLSGMDYAPNSSVPATPTDSCGPSTVGSSSPTQSPSLTVTEPDDEDFSGMDYAQRSGVPTTPTGSYGPSTIGSSSPTQSSSLTVVEPSPGSANGTAESDGASGMRIQTKGSSNDTSQTGLSMVIPARNAAASMVLAKVTDNGPATSMTVAAGTVMRCKLGHVPRRLMVSSKPFVCGLSIEQYAPSKRIRVQKLRLTTPGTSRKKQPLVPRTVSTKQASLLGPMLSVFRKAAPRRLLPGPKTPTPKLLKVVQRRQGGKLVCRCPAAGSATWGSTQVMDVNELSPRLSCVPRFHMDRFSNDNANACEGKQDSTIQVSAASPHNSAISHEKPSISCRIGTLTKKQRLTQSTPVMDPDAMSPSGSPPSSPDLSLLPSQSRRVVTNAEIKQTVTPSIGCGDQNLPSTAATPRSGDSSVLTDSSRPSTIGSSPSTQSSPPTVIAPSPSSANTMAGSDGTSKISSTTNGTCAEVSYMTGVPTIISKDATISSMAMLANLMDRQVSSFTGISENSHRSRMTVRRAMEISRTFLSSPGRPSQLSIPTTSPMTMGINVSQLRNLFIPKPDKNAKRSIGPTMRAEIGILRVQKKVTGGVVVDPRLNRRPPVASILKRLGLSGSGSPSPL